MFSYPLHAGIENTGSRFKKKKFPSDTEKILNSSGTVKTASKHILDIFNQDYAMAVDVLTECKLSIKGQTHSFLKLIWAILAILIPIPCRFYFTRIWPLNVSWEPEEQIKYKGTHHVFIELCFILLFRFSIKS